MVEYTKVNAGLMFKKVLLKLRKGFPVSSRKSNSVPPYYDHGSNSTTMASKDKH